ncbi:21109_t:CDS:1, partial [Cetraspora pellucida]
DLLADGKDIDITDENIKLLNIIENERPSVERLYKSTSCNCGPDKKCFMMIPLDEFLMRRAYFQSLSKNMQDIYLMAQILAFDGGFMTTNKKRNRQNMRTFWRYNNNILLCKKVYEHMHGISETRIKNIKRHLKDNGLSIRHHGNEGRTPTRHSMVVIRNNIVKLVRDFINNYAEVHGLPSPGRHLCRDTHQTIYLPTVDTKKKLYNLYINSITNFDEAKMSESTFCRLWNIYAPEVQIMSPRSDLCEVCQRLKFEISHNYGDTGVKINEYLAHINLARGER